MINLAPTSYPVQPYYAIVSESPKEFYSMQFLANVVAGLLFYSVK